MLNLYEIFIYMIYMKSFIRFIYLCDLYEIYRIYMKSNWICMLNMTVVCISQWHDDTISNS